MFQALRLPQRITTWRWPTAVYQTAIAVLCLGSTGIALNVLNSNRRFEDFNVDEFQHAHLAWQTIQGKLIFRDFFDHHGPLFAFWNALLYQLAGLTPSFETFTFYRDVTFAYTIATAAVVGLLANHLSGYWLAPALSMTLYLTSGTLSTAGIENRPDGLMTLLLMTGVYAGMRNHRLTMGVLLGLAFWVHPKAILWFAPIFLGAAMGVREKNSAAEWKQVLRELSWTCAGVLSVTGLVFLFFAFHDSTYALFQCTVLANFGSKLYDVPTELSTGAMAKHSPPNLWRYALNRDLPLVTMLGISVLATPNGLRHYFSSPQRFLRVLVAAIPILAIQPFHRHWLICLIPIASLAPALLPRTGILRVAALPFAFMVPSLNQSFQSVLRAPSPGLQQQYADFMMAKETLPEADPVAYLWPSRCAAHVFHDDANWMWMLSPTLGYARGGGPVEDLSRSEGKRMIYAVEQGSPAWLIADNTSIDTLPPDLQTYVGDHFHRQGCVLHSVRLPWPTNAP